MLKHDRGFRTKNFIVGFLYFCMLCCFLPRLLCFCSIQSACMLLQTDSNTFWAQVIDYSLPGSTCHIRFRIDISHLSIFGIVVHGKSYISHRFYFYGILYLYLLFDFCVCMWPKSFAIAFIITFFLFLYSVGVSETDWQYFLQTFYYSLTRRCVTWIGFLLLSFFL